MYEKPKSSLSFSRLVVSNKLIKLNLLFLSITVCIHLWLVVKKKKFFG